MPEATRRSNEIKSLLVKAAGVPEKQIVTRITTRPGAQGVDVVVSALRAQQGPAPAAAAPRAAEIPAGGELRAGETGRKQLREAVQARQADIERCIGFELVLRRIDQADVQLRLTIDPQGRPSKVEVGAGPLASEDVRACISAAAKTWTFPRSGSEYAIEVPITVVAPGKKP
jgi:hypothetical protein